MNTIDIRRPKIVTYRSVEHKIGDAWVALFRGRGIVSSAIQNFTRGAWSHAGLLACHDRGVDLLEVREFHGGRRVTLASQVSLYPRQIDIFSCNAEVRWHFDQAAAVESMRKFTGQKYGWAGALRLGLSRIPGLWHFFPVETDDLARGAQPFCSHAVCTALREGGIDPVPNMPDYLVTPTMLATSLFLEYQFTLE